MGVFIERDGRIYIDVGRKLIYKPASDRWPLDQFGCPTIVFARRL